RYAALLAAFEFQTLLARACRDDRAVDDLRLGVVDGHAVAAAADLGNDPGRGRVGVVQKAVHRFVPLESFRERSGQIPGALDLHGTVVDEVVAVVFRISFVAEDDRGGNRGARPRKRRAGERRRVHVVEVEVVRLRRHVDDEPVVLPVGFGAVYAVDGEPGGPADLVGDD